LSGVRSMSEVQNSTYPDPVAAVPVHSAGALLRAAREASGLHVAALAVAMKVPVKKLEALEADRFDLLPDAVFVRALASSVCRALKVDPLPVLAKLPQSTAPRLGSDDRGINAPFHSPGSGKRFVVPDMLTKPASIAVLVLLVGAVLLVMLPDHVLTGKELVGAQVIPAAQLPVEPVKTETKIPVASTTAPMQPIAAVVPSPVSPPALELAQPAPVVVDGILGFKARGASWVEVTDAKGVVQFRKTLASGDRAVASGTPPLSVVIGRADVTDVEVRGVAFPLDALAKDNVARFEVK
jgi:cytoskeleton protein RodZ